MLVTNIDNRNFYTNVKQSIDDLVTFGGAGTVQAATILARDSATGKLIPYVKGGSANGNGVPKAIALTDVTASGAGDVATNVAVEGEFILEYLKISADGDASNIDAAVIDQLRAYNIIVLDIPDKNILDNQ